MIAITGFTGKLGGSVLHAILAHSIIPPSQPVPCTTSTPQDARWDSLKAQGATVRQSSFDDPGSMRAAFAGCAKLLLVSSPRVELDFNKAPRGEGREKHHFAAIGAAKDAGVQHIFYTSLAFKPRSSAGVMRAHTRTEQYLAEVAEQTGIKVTVIREGLYNESWPLYFGYYDPKGDDRRELVVAGDGPVSWTALADLGLGTALVVAEPSAKYVGKTFYLSVAETRTLKDIAGVVSRVKGTEVRLKVVSCEEYCRFYEKDMGRDGAEVEWWSSTYDSLAAGDCVIEDGTLGELLKGRGVRPKRVEETIREMLVAN